jgi:hypothetical protein
MRLTVWSSFSEGRLKGKYPKPRFLHGPEGVAAKPPNERDRGLVSRCSM